MFNVISISDLLATLCSVIALLLLFKGWRRRLTGAVKWALAGLITLTLFHDLTNFLEWAGIADTIALEYYIEILVPVMWFLFFYIFLREVEAHEIRDSEKKYATLIGNIPDVTWTRDKEGHMVFVSSNVEAIYGHTPEEVCKESERLWFGSIHADDAEDVKKAFKALFGMGVSLDVEYRVKRKDGKWIWLHDRSTGVYRKDGKFYADGIFEDITTRKKVEDEIKSLSSAVAQASEGIAVVDLDGNLQFCNESFADMHGYALKEVEGKNLSMFHTADQMLQVDKVNRQLKEKGQVEAEVRHTRRDGTVFPAIMHNTLLRDAKGDPVGMIGTLRDVTEQKKHIEELGIFKNFSESAGQAFGFADLEGKVLYANKTLLKIMGHKKLEDAIGTLVFSYYPEELKKRLQEEALPKVLKEGDWVGESALKSVDGKVTPTIENIFAIKDEKGEPMYYANVITDITERKRAEEKIQKSLDEWNDTFNSISDLVMILDSDFRIINANKATSKFVKVSASEMIGNNCYKLIHGMDHPPEGCPLEKAKKTKKHEDTELYLSKIGIWARISVDPVLDGKGNIIGAVHIVRDITARKKAENILRENEEKYRSLFETAGDAIFIMDVSKDHGVRFLDCNERTLRLFGCVKRDQIIGKTPLDFSPPVQPDGQSSQEKVMKLADSIIVGHSQIFEWAHQRLDGSPFLVEVTLTRLVLGGENLLQAVVRDITERKKIDEMKDVLIRDVSHSLKTPIATAKMAQSICEEGLKIQDMQKTTEFQKMVTDNINAAHKDITNILELFAITAKEPLTMKQKVPLNVVAAKIARDIKGSIENKNIDLEIDIPKDASEIRGNKREITTLLANIIDNAVKFTEKGGIKLSARLAGDMIEIKIKDTGPGVAEKDRDKLFEKFQQGHAAFSGVGLGLAISREIVERHDGNIKLESNKGKGTTIVILLPRA